MTFTQDEEEEARMAERRRLMMRDILPMAVLLINICALVWGAAKMSSSIDDLKTTVADLRTTTRNLATDIADVKIDYNARIKVLEDRDGRRTDSVHN